MPGGGRLMINLGTGNLLLQDDDMSVPHKGIALAFRRTYNSQGTAVVNGANAAWRSLYGNGWTNTFDAHLVAASGYTSVYDIDGARYDYVPNDANNPALGFSSATPGQHAVLAWDHACGMTWTKKSGTVYYFYDVQDFGACPALVSGPMGGYAGRLHQIIGRNANTNLTFAYSWDGGNASPSGKINTITATTESGLSATLSFGDVNGRRLLQQLTFPDSATSVSYGYDANGNLTTVTKPSNNAAGTKPQEWYGYDALGADFVMTWLASPRWVVQCNVDNCGGDGAYSGLAYAGSDLATSSVSSVQHFAVVNPNVNDATGYGPLQSGFPTYAYSYLTEYYTTGASSPTFRDTDGHMTNWVMDGSGRPTQTQECTTSASQGQQCTGTWLLLNETWNADNNLTSTVDARGFQTDFGYDANGNTVAVGEPQTTTSVGTFRPTKLYDYDGFNNVVAYCDETQTHAAHVVWSASLSGSDSLCASNSGAAPHWRATFDYPTAQPYGRLTTMSTPLGYTRRFSYDTAHQAGADYGLPTAVTGDQITQLDGTQPVPAQTLWYDTHGHLRCYSKGSGTYVLSYDALGRMTSEADPDDTSANASSLCAKSTGTSGWNTQTAYTYFPDGTKQSVQTPAERAYGVSTTYSYDADGSVVTETTHHGCVPAQTCVAGTTQKWYDGADRLVEVAQPHDPRSITNPPSMYDGDAWLTRYFYDLSAGNTVAVTGSAGFQAYGNLYKTQTYLGQVTGTPGWTDLRGSAFDGLDREVQKFSYSIPAHQLETASQQFDGTPATLGLLWKKTNPSGELATYVYDELARTLNVAYSGDSGLTPGEAFAYDPSGRTVSVTSAQYGAEQRSYDDDGRLTTVIEPGGGGLTDPARLSYSYYGNGWKSALSVTSPTFTQANAIAYSYRPDGVLKTQAANAFQSGAWNKTYTDAGRLLSISGVDTQNRTYDSTGQLATYALGGSTLSYTHDAEGSVRTVVVPNVDTGNVSGPETETLTNTLNVRGDLVDQIYTPNTYFQFAHHRSTIYLGYRDTFVIAPDGTMPTEEPDQNVVDYVNAVRQRRTTYGSAESYNGSSYGVGTSSTFTFDPVGRETLSDSVSDTFNQWTTENNITHTTAPHKVTQIAKAYDAENHTRTIHTILSGRDRVQNGPTTTTDRGTMTIGWGPNGHPVQVQNFRYGGGTGTAYPDMTLHWDGDALLFVTDASGNVMSFKVGLDGETGPGNQNGMFVYDRDTAGVLLMTSNATGHGGITPLDPGDLTGPSLPSSYGYTANTPPRLRPFRLHPQRRLQHRPDPHQRRARLQPGAWQLDDPGRLRRRYPRPCIATAVHVEPQQPVRVQ
jgi:YD repeat-containing protein